jgi:hypothetical protein
VREKFDNFISEIPAELRELFKISHIKFLVKEKIILHAAKGVKNSELREKEKSSYLVYLEARLIEAVENNPDLFSDDFEFLFQNSDEIEDWRIIKAT